MLHEFESADNLVYRKGKLDFATVKEAARGSWPRILSDLGIPANYLSNKHTSCPVCGGVDRFRFDDKGDGRFFCNNCGSGDGFELLRLATGRPMGSVLQMVADYVGFNENHSWSSYRLLPPPNLTQLPAEQVRRRRARLNRLWVESKPVQVGDPVEQYLTARKIRLEEFPEVLRFHPALEYYECDRGSYRLLGTYPAMLARVDDSDGMPVTLHRTYLTENGRKAPVPEPKKLVPAAKVGSISGSAIRLFKAERKLAVAEGIETALAVYLQNDGQPVWATISSAGMEKVLVPQQIEEIVICADLDSTGAGERSSQQLAIRMLRDGRKVKIAMPPGPIPAGAKGIDWADFLLGV